MFSVLPWIGLNDKDVEGNFVWVSDNSTVYYSNWDRGDPNNAGQGEHCVLIWTRDHKWDDAPCGWHRRPLCEKPYVHGVQRRMISGVNYFVFLRLLCFALFSLYVT